MAGRSSGLLLAALVALAGCSRAPEPVTRAEAPPARTDPAVSPSPPPAPAPPAAPPSNPGRDDKPVVVDPGDEDGSPVSLVEAARAEKERRAQAGKPVAVITDKTLPGYASKGQITVADPKEKEKKAAAAQPAPGEPPVRGEPYWRDRALDIRLRWRQAADEVGELEQKSAELRQQFYREDDPTIRDNRIKPEWDRVLDRLRQARLEVDAVKKELEQFLEEGRSAGALPGWLGEGEEQEPRDEAKKKEPQAPAQAIEPPVLEPPPVLDDGERR